MGRGRRAGALVHQRLLVETQRTVPVGVGNVVDIEHWRLQVRLGTSTSALRTFELRRDPLSDQWLLQSITEN